MRPNPIRVVAAAAATVLAAVALTGCSGGAGGGCTPRAATGDAAQSVSVTTPFGTAPQVTFPSPTHVDETQVAVNVPGTGAPIQAAQQIVADLTFYDATTGKAITATGYTGDKGAATFVVRTVGIPGLTAALVCSRVGERLTAVIPPSQGIPAGSRPAGVAATDSIVAVVDVRRAYLARADGTPQVMAGGLPSVVLASDGRPGVTLPEGKPPTTLQVADLRKGSGAVVARGETAVVQYTAVVWNPGEPVSGQVFQSTWTDGTPRSLPLVRGQIVPGLITALAGQRVGSQVLAVVPASLGYGTQSSDTLPAGSTLVYVVDILGKA